MGRQLAARRFAGVSHHYIDRHIDGHPLELGLTANKFCDGRIDADRER